MSVSFFDEILRQIVEKKDGWGGANSRGVTTPATISVAVLRDVLVKYGWALPSLYLKTCGTIWADWGNRSFKPIKVAFLADGAVEFVAPLYKKVVPGDVTPKMFVDSLKEYISVARCNS